MQSLESITSHIHHLHHLPMTDLEQNLKRCLEMRPDVKDHVLTTTEMTEYIQWMVENFGDHHLLPFSERDIPDLPFGGNMSDIARELIHNQHTQQRMEQLRLIYDAPQETHFFSGSEDITASRYLRHLPAYWNAGDYFEVMYVFSGSCPVWFENEHFDLKPGGLLITPPSTSRALCLPADDCSAIYFMIRSSTFSQVFLDQLPSLNLMSLFFHQALKSRQHTNYLRFDLKQDVQMEMIMISILDEYKDNTQYSSQIVNLQMSSFFLQMLKRYESTATLSSNNSLHWKPAFTGIFNYIQTHFQTATVDDLAARFNYSNRQIIRIVQNSTGMCFSKLILKLRMEKAAHLLRGSTLPIDDIGAKIGYSSPSSFYRAFIAYYGCTPKQYRLQ